MLAEPQVVSDVMQGSFAGLILIPMGGGFRGLGAEREAGTMELFSASCLSVAEDRKTALMAMGCFGLSLEIRLSEQRRFREVDRT